MSIEKKFTCWVVTIAAIYFTGFIGFLSVSAILDAIGDKGALIRALAIAPAGLIGIAGLWFGVVIVWKAARS